MNTNGPRAKSSNPNIRLRNEVGFGRELFGVFPGNAAMPAELGASVFGPDGWRKCLVRCFV